MYNTDQKFTVVFTVFTVEVVDKLDPFKYYCNNP